MKWHDSYKYKPKHGTQIWLWNKNQHRKEIFNAFWDENSWNPSTLPKDYSPMWSYVFQDIEPISISLND